jgi:hypothetical protein
VSPARSGAARPSMRLPLIGNLLRYGLMYLLIAFSGIFFFMDNKVLQVALFAVSGAVFFYENLRIDREFIDVLILLCLLSAAQGFAFHSLSVESALATLMYYSSAYLLVKTIGSRFTEYYVNTIYVLTLIGLAFYGMSLASPGFLSFLSAIPRALHSDPHNHENFFIYTVQKVYTTSLHILRNSGPVYEAGMFAVTLILALIFNTVRRHTLFNKKNSVFMAAILSTFSTAGYLALFCFLIFYFACEKDLFKKAIWVPLLLFISVFAYYNLSFMSKKIERDVKFSEYYQGRNSGRYSNLGRIGSALVDLQTIRKHPLTGTGRTQENRFVKVSRNKNGLLSSHRTNGVFDFLAENGIPFSILFFYLMHRSLARLCEVHRFDGKFALYSLLLILLVGSSQTIFMRPLFLGLIFLRLPFKFLYSVPIPAETKPIHA